MNKLTKSKILLIFPLAMLLFLSSCSDDNEDVSANKASENGSSVSKDKDLKLNKMEDKQNYKSMSNPVDKPSITEKKEFKAEFSKDCINRETRNAENKNLNLEYIEKTCHCIADYMDDHLTDQEAEEFLGEDNHMRALQIRYDTGAYQCTQRFSK